MDKKKRRGRPRVAEKMMGDSADQFETIAKNGQRFRTQRSVTDNVYALRAMMIISEAASDIEGLEYLFSDEKRYMCRSILSQLGRMYITEGYDTKSVILWVAQYFRKRLPKMEC